MQQEKVTVKRLVFLLVVGSVAASGCELVPEVAYEPTLHNPFPQISRVAVAPFFNHSSEPTVDGHQFALAYYHELQSVPGFEVIPVDVVEQAMREYNIQLTGPADARRLAQLLGADVLVVGAVTDYSPYYPPRCGLHVEWYAANPCFHPVPPGYALPWGTPEEEYIPPEVVFEAEFALAKEQLKTQTPIAPDLDTQVPEPIPTPAPEKPVQQASYQEQTQQGSSQAGTEEAALAPAGNGQAVVDPRKNIPGWPDPRGLIPPGPSATRPECVPQSKPIMTHTRIYRGDDPHFTAALASYWKFRDDARFGGWQGYLERSEDFIRFCCRMHIWEMLSARGGAGPARVVWRWPVIR